MQSSPSPRRRPDRPRRSLPLSHSLSLSLSLARSLRQHPPARPALDMPRQPTHPSLTLNLAPFHSFEITYAFFRRSRIFLPEHTGAGSSEIRDSERGFPGCFTVTPNGRSSRPDIWTCSRTAADEPRGGGEMQRERERERPNYYSTVS
jgi:hypothetical protein